ncbi:S8 family serine peptidase [Arenimonas sp.]|uniref:S8 family serine peptidase n=1 Tax=Arenimonas sp. TaxID=1872635 RepID=UPI002E3004CD|nr:S8 family serine peptidase [Arenimonas sp.]HEX4853319.1 S8 family serine peptidase [Arenimonas sp.]
MRTTLSLSITLALALGANAASAEARLGSSLQDVLGQGGTHEVIVTFRDTEAARSISLYTLKYQLLSELPMAGAVLTRTQIEALAARDDVESIYLNEPLSFGNHEAAEITGGHFVHDQYGAKGAGVTVAVIDSGIDANHPDLSYGSTTVQNVKLVGDLGLAGVAAAIENQPNTDTSSGHGTHVAGTVAGTGAASANDPRRAAYYDGIAPEASLIGLGAGEGLNIFFALQGFDWVLANQQRYGIDIVTNSWGSSESVYDPSNPINRASYEAYRRGMVVTFAAGNDGPTEDTLNPYAIVPWVVNVGSGTKDKALSDFSSRGLAGDFYKHIDVVAPGSGICSTRAIGTAIGATGTLLDATDPTYTAYYHCISGTSMATPFVAGTAALMLEVNPELSPDQIERLLMETANPMPGQAYQDVGGGYINVARAVEAAALEVGERTAFLAGATAWSSQGAWNTAAENNDNISLEGRWRAVSDATAVDGAFTSASLGKREVPRARFAFSGSAFQLRFPRNASGGQADVYVDGVLRGRVSYLSATAESDARFAVAGLETGVHQVELRAVQGQVYLDGVLVDGALLEPTVSLVQQSSRFEGSIGPSVENLEVDEYALEVPADGVSVRVQLGWSGVADLDLELLDPEGRAIASAASLANPEVLDVQVTLPGTYRIRVNGYASLLTNYRVDAVVSRAVASP